MRTITGILAALHRAPGGMGCAVRAVEVTALVLAVRTAAVRATGEWIAAIERQVRCSPVHYRMTDQALADDFQTEPAGAAEKYNGKVVQVSGQVLHSRRDWLGRTVVELEGTHWVQVHCCFGEDHGRVPLGVNQPVTIVGKCAGRFFDHVTLTGCVRR